MIERTFQLCKGMGPWREKALWAQGIAEWEDFLAAKRAGAIIVSGPVDAALEAAIKAGQSAIEASDVQALAAMVPKREHWRLYRRFADQTAFIDIEAGHDREISVVGVMDAAGVASFISPHTTDECQARLARSDVWVTFNGASFDVPMLLARFPNLEIPRVHLDLRPLLGRAGHHGGLKDIEEALGLNRPAHLKGLAGLDAIALWSEYQRSHRIESLRLLVEYNLYDVIGLRTLLDLCIERLSELNAWDQRRAPIFDRGDVLYDVSKLLLALAP